MSITTTSPVLVLSNALEPLTITTAQRALVMWCNGAARIVESYDRVFYRSMRIPSVVSLSEHKRIPFRKLALTRRNVLLRDRHTCQYCRKHMTADKLTLDHVHPRSRGGKDAWDNLVACCHPCNNRKGSKTTVEAGMDLMKIPKEPTGHANLAFIRAAAESRKTWQNYVYM